jgi:hypothetical protein
MKKINFFVEINKMSFKIFILLVLSKTYFTSDKNTIHESLKKDIFSV